MRQTLLAAAPLLGRTRNLSAACGITALLALTVVREGDAASRLALLGFVGFALAAAVGWAEGAATVRPKPANPTSCNRIPKSWLFTAGAVALVGGIAAQSWFQPGTSIGSGDITLPNGTAWIGRLFEPWSWSGSNLGEPSQLPLALPWAAILGLVHALGGDAGLAQRIWYTALFILAGLSALSFAAALGMRPIAGFVAAMVYLFNPFVVSEVNTNPVFLAALGPLAALPAALVAAGTSRWPMRWSVLLIALEAPILGYVFFNPPLVGMILGAALATPLVVAWIEGRDPALRSLLTLLVAAPLLTAACAYWIIPAALHLASFSGTQFANISSWSWTETRATLRNGLWLNNTWGWSHPEYYPYAATYDSFPLALARFVLPAIALGALVIRPVVNGPNHQSSAARDLRLVIALATAALLIILMSTGTNPPGNTIFDPLYNVPYGWLLREPGRFLMVSALAYAVLIAVLTERLIQGQFSAEMRTQRLVAAASLRLSWLALRLSFPAPRRSMSSIRLAEPAARLLRSALRLAVAPIAIAAIALLGYPTYTGAVVPDHRPLLPPAHVTMPAYWQEMATYVDNMPGQGGVLVMPPDDYYAMPYTWGYYGADSFIVDLFRRPVLVPNTQGGYVPTSSEVVSAVGLVAQSILNHEWRRVGAAVVALNTPFILVRRDVQTSFPGRSILPPDEIAQSLTEAPNFQLVRRFGYLDLFGLGNWVDKSSPELSTTFATVDTQTPDLRLLSIVPSGTDLVSNDPLMGVSSIEESPPVDQWTVRRGALAWEPSVRPGATLQIADLNTQTVLSLKRASKLSLPGTGQFVTYTPGGNYPVTVSVSATSVIANGDFRAGQWGPVADCNATPATEALAQLTGSIIDPGLLNADPALELSASYDSACEGQPVEWRGGALVLDLMVRSVSGGAPRLCLWQVGPDRCAALPSLPDTTSWSEFHASVRPDSRATALTLYLYADGNVRDSRTVIDYADVRVLQVPTLPSLALFQDPIGQVTPSVKLALVRSSFSPAWQASPGGKHVLVDGMLNGWLVPSGAGQITVFYKSTSSFVAGERISIAAVLVALLILIGPWATSLLMGLRSRTTPPG